MWEQQLKCNWHPENCHHNHKQLEGDVTNDLVHIKYHQMDENRWHRVLEGIFFISVPFQWNSREFLLKKWEKENIPFAQSHNTVRDARLKHSWNPMMKMSVFWFWNMLLSMIGIFEAPPMSCPVFLSNHYFSLLKKWCIFLFMLFHTQNLGYFSWSCCEVRMWV